MSTDLSVYTADPVSISAKILCSRMKKSGWILLVMKGRHDLSASGSPLKREASYELYGIKKAAHLDAVRSTLKRGSREALEPLYEKGLLNSVLMSVGKIEEPEELEQWGLDHEDPELLLEYAINGHGAPLQFELWKQLGRITGGILTDPQSGKLIRPAKGRKKT